MIITNSFHSSGKAHAIGSSGKLSSVQRHNERGYFTFEYSPNKIHDLVGTASRISTDVRDYINEKFQTAIDEYNQKQKRKDRKITKKPFEYFCDNKKLDIANEAVFQIGDMEFWSTTRIENEITRNGKSIVLKDFPEHIKVIMDNIYLKQAMVYENIYVTHKDEIFKRIKKDYDYSQRAISQLSENDVSFYESITAMKGLSYKLMVASMPDDEKVKFDRYLSAKAVIDFVDEKRLFQRIENNEMEIKLINLTTHYDEYSPHAHGISVCSTRGFEQGLKERVSKSVVLNKWCLSVIQDRLHEIAKEEIGRHTELFNVELRDKEKGRKKHFSVEGYKDLKEKEKLNKLLNEIKTAETTLEDKKQLVKEMEANCPIKSQEELEVVEAEVEEGINEMMDIIHKTDNIIYNLEIERKNPSSDRINSMVDDLIWYWNKNLTRLNELFISIKEKISNIKVFEILRQIPEKLRSSVNLENRMQDAFDRSKLTDKLINTPKIQDKEEI